MSYFNVAHIKLCTKVEGPFKRCCIWFQGCNINCKNCINKDLQPLEIRHLLSLDQLMKIIDNAKKDFDIEGVTFTGGEPLLQQDLYELCREIQKMNLGIILFSGFNEDSIPEKLKNVIDLGLIGPYVYQKKDSQRFLIGSTNKKIINFSNRYLNQISYYDLKNHDIIAEVCLDKNSFFINGD